MNRVDLNSRIQINNSTYNNTLIKQKDNSKLCFEEVFQRTLENKNDIKFSKHAIERMSIRNIKLNKEEISRIENAIGKAEKKGIKEALILMNNTAFIASVKNKTIITTANTDQLKEQVFTNIDGAVII